MRTERKGGTPSSIVLAVGADFDVGPRVSGRGQSGRGAPAVLGRALFTLLPLTFGHT